MRDHLGVAANLLQEVAEIDRLHVEARGARALPGNEQEVVDKNREMLGLLDNALDRTLVIGNPLVRTAQSKLAFATDDRERLAKLVADIGEKAAAGFVDLSQRFVRPTKFFGAGRDQRLEIGMGVLQGGSMRLEVGRHAVEALAEIGELVAAGDGDAMGEIAVGEFRCAAQKLGERSAQAAQQQDRERKCGDNSERGMDLAYALEPTQELGRVGVDPDDLGGLVGETDIDQPVQLLIDAASEQIVEFLPGDVRLAAAAQLLDLAELVERALEFLPDLRQPRELGGLGLPLVRIDDGELLFGKRLKRREIGFDYLVKIGRAERPVGHSGQKRVGPGLMSCWLWREI